MIREQLDNIGQQKRQHGLVNVNNKKQNLKIDLRYVTLCYVTSPSFSFVNLIFYVKTVARINFADFHKFSA